MRLAGVQRCGRGGFNEVWAKNNFKCRGLSIIQEIAADAVSAAQVVFHDRNLVQFRFRRRCIVLSCRKMSSNGWYWPRYSSQKKSLKRCATSAIEPTPKPGSASAKRPIRVRWLNLPIASRPHIETARVLPSPTSKIFWAKLRWCVVPTESCGPGTYIVDVLSAPNTTPSEET